jgi:hypothetical protein
MAFPTDLIPLILLAEAAGPRALPASAGLVIWCYRLFKGKRVEVRTRHFAPPRAARRPSERFAACHRLAVTYR